MNRNQIIALTILLTAMLTAATTALALQPIDTTVFPAVGGWVRVHRGNGPISMRMERIDGSAVCSVVLTDPEATDIATALRLAVIP